MTQQQLSKCVLLIKPTTNSCKIKYKSHQPNLNINVSYHDGEYNSSHSGLEDPQQSQTKDLDEGEEMNLPKGNMSQVNQVRLMLRRHQKKLETIHKLQTIEVTTYGTRWAACMSRSGQQLVTGLHCFFKTIYLTFPTQRQAKSKDNGMLKFVSFALNITELILFYDK